MVGHKHPSSALLIGYCCIKIRSSSLIILLLISENIGQSTLAAVLTVRMVGHKHPSSALLCWALSSLPPHLTAVFHAVVLEHEHRDIIVRVLDLLGSSVVLLLPFLGRTPLLGTLVS